MTLLNQEGLLNQRAAIIHSWTNGRTTSAKEMTPAEITEMCLVLEKPKDFKGLDKKRKRLIAAIFGYFEKMNKQVTMEYVKGVACIAAKEEYFNRIPPDRLDSLYNAFIKRQKDLEFTGKIIAGYINEQQHYN